MNIIKKISLLFICAFTSIFEVNAQIISTVAGTGTGGYYGDNGPATLAKLNGPAGVTIDKIGNLYISDIANYCIRKIDTLDIITTIAGIGVAGYYGDNVPATNAKMGQVCYIYVSNTNNIYLPDRDNHRLRMININGIITTIAGNGLNGETGDGGPATNAAVAGPYTAKVDKMGYVYMTDDCAKIWKIDTLGNIHIIAGTTQGFSGDGGRADTAQLNVPGGLAIDRFGNIYFGDANNDRIRKIDTLGFISTIAGNGILGYSGDNGVATNAMINTPEGVAVDDVGNVYLSDVGNSIVRKIDTNGIITTVVGTRVVGYNGDNMPATDAQLAYPTGLAFDKYGNLYIGDLGNNRVRKVTNVGVMVNEVKEVVQEKSEYLVYPNPASKTVTIDGVIGCEVAMYDMLGNEKWKGRSEKSKVVIDVSGWVNGVYILEITDVGTGERVVKRVVKE